MKDHIENKSEFISIVPTQVEDPYELPNKPNHLNKCFYWWFEYSSEPIRGNQLKKYSYIFKQGTAEQATTVCARKANSNDSEPTKWW